MSQLLDDALATSQPCSACQNPTAKTALINVGAGVFVCRSCFSSVTDKLETCASCGDRFYAKEGWPQENGSYLCPDCAFTKAELEYEASRDSTVYNDWSDDK